MGLLSRFEGKMEDAVEGGAAAIAGGGLSPVQITKKAEKQMRREKMVGAGKQYAPTLYTVLVSPDDDEQMFSFYPTLAGEIETYLTAKAGELGFMMDGQPLVRFISDPELKRGKFDVVAELVAAPILARLRSEEMQRYGLGDASVAVAGNAANPNLRPIPTGPGQAGQPVDDYYAQDADSYYNGYGEEGEDYYDIGMGDRQPVVPYEHRPARAQAVPMPAAQGGTPQPAAGYSIPSQQDAPDPEAPTVDIPESDLDAYLYDESRDKAYALSGQAQNIGRESGNDIVVPDINVSRVHAQIAMQPDGTWIVSDLGSTNGVFVNGRHVQSCPLRDADMILLGTTELEFQLLS